MTGRGWARGLAVALLAVGALTGPAAAAPGIGPAVYGAGSGPLDEDRIHVVVTALGRSDSVRGRFVIVHQTPTGIFAYLSGEVDCLNVSGGIATVTGTINRGFDGVGIDPVGQRVSLTVRDGTPDVVDMDVSFVSGHAIGPCTADPVVSIPMTSGGFRIA